MTRAHLVAIALVCLTAVAMAVISNTPQPCTDSLPGLGGHCHPLAHLVVDDCTPVCRCPP